MTILPRKEIGKKSMYITGPFLAGNQVNKNGRFYPMNFLDREAATYIKERIDGKCAWGELNHPSTPTVNLDRAALMVKELRKEGNNYIGKAKILENQPMGAIAKGLIEEGGRLGVSSRGVGSLKPHEKGYQLVQDDFPPLCRCRHCFRSFRSRLFRARHHGKCRVDL